MKPDKAIKMKTPSDLVLYWVIMAEDKIRRKLNPEYKIKQDKFIYTLKVASQDFKRALTIAAVGKYDVEIEFSYDRDEWSLRGYAYDFIIKDGKDITIEYEHEIWSAGA